MRCLSVAIAAALWAGATACGDSRPEVTDTAAAHGPDATVQASVSCMQARTEALDRVDGIVARNARGCTADSECVLIDASLPCQDSCQSAIYAPRRSAFEQELAEFASTTCPTLPSTCGISPNCAALAGVRCDNGICGPVPAGSKP